MSISIEKSERFQREYKEFSSRINQVNDLKLKTDLELELNKLLNEVKKIDANHINVMSKNTLSDMVDESRFYIAEIRKKLSKSLADYESSIKS